MRYPGKDAAGPRAGGLLPVAGPKPRILILGSFPSRLSLAHARYYGNPRNHFWAVMEALFGIDPALPYGERIPALKTHGIALWDVVASCSRPGSADARITGPAFNDIAGFAAAHPGLRLVALNGRTAGRYYARIAGAVPIPYLVLPSTSPAHAGMPVAEKIRQWSVILQES
jgi:hypoxanthine-DNA glycosylase